jgi:hypothetical protein
MRSPYPTHRHAAAVCRKDGGQPANRYTGAGARQGGDRRGSPALADLERQGKGCADYSRAPPHRHAGLPGRRRREKGSVVTPAGAARDRPLSDQLERVAGQLCRTPSCRFAGRHVDHGRNRQLPGQPPHEQIPADAMVAPRRRSPAPGSLRRLQRQTRFQLAIPGRRSRLRAGNGCLTPIARQSP